MVDWKAGQYGMKKTHAIVAALCVVVGLPLAMQEAPPVAQAAVGTTYGPYTVTSTVTTAGPLTGSDTAENAPVYEVTSMSPTPLTMSSGYAVIVLTGVSHIAAVSQMQITETAHATIYLPTGSTNTFTCNDTSSTGTGHRAGIEVSPSASLTIEGSGTLNATGGNYGAGIGGTYLNTSTSDVQAANESGAITIDGGIVNATSGTYAAGIGGALNGSSGTVTINGGTVTASSTDGGAGIGGGRDAPGGTTVINGGTVYATGGAIHGGAGIGGGGDINAGSLSTGNLEHTGGNITITGGSVTASSQVGSAGIGGGFWSKSGTITITSGTIKAKALGGGTGIGAGGRSMCDTITISGGNITATGTSQAAGIGNGTGVTGGKIIISGGTIVATSAVSNASGIGGGADLISHPGSATVVITGGNVYSGNSDGQIQVNTNPTNGESYGLQSIYAIDVTLEDSNGHFLPNADLSIGVTAGYTYSATTNASGHAYIWLPVGTYPLLMTNSMTATYADYQLVVTKPTGTVYDAVEQIIKMVTDEPLWKWFETDSIKKLYGLSQLNLSINHNNSCTNSTPSQIAICEGKAIVGVDWYRENVTNPVNTIDSFTAGFAAASQDDSGVGATDSELELQSGDTTDQQNYLMTITANGRYWVQVHLIGVNTGSDVFLVKSVDVTDIYTPVTVSVRDWNVNFDTQMKPYTELPPTSPAEQYGIPFDLDGTVLSGPATVYDSVTYERNLSQPTPPWNMTVPDVPFGSTVGDTTSTITLDTSAVPANADLGSTPINLLYTVNYSSPTFIVVYDANGGVGDSFTQDSTINTGTVNLDAVSVSDAGFAPSTVNTVFVGWNTATDGSGTPYNPGDTIAVSDNLTLYAQWGPATTTLTISKTVEGPLADRTRPFSFTIRLEDSDGPITADISANFVCTGREDQPCPTGPVVVTDGSGSFTLADGQSVTLEDVPMTATVQIIEAIVRGWAASYTDSLDPGTLVPSNDTDPQPMAEDRTFAFLNTREAPPATGVDSGDASEALVLPVLTLLVIAPILLAARIRRLRGV
ncbi:MAG: InlB B-repeat-containing protein [Propionibacteriaceae bacterium]|nr:InlB B-repeat-containing protein [Propionibacteriaceae bacterium]